MALFQEMRSLATLVTTCSLLACAGGGSGGAVGGDGASGTGGASATGGTTGSGGATSTGGAGTGCETP